MLVVLSAQPPPLGNLPPQNQTLLTGAAYKSQRKGVTNQCRTQVKAKWNKTKPPNLQNQKDFHVVKRKWNLGKLVTTFDPLFINNCNNADVMNYYYNQFCWMQKNVCSLAYASLERSFSNSGLFVVKSKFMANLLEKGFLRSWECKEIGHNIEVIQDQQVPLHLKELYFYLPWTE